MRPLRRPGLWQVTAGLYFCEPLRQTHYLATVYVYVSLRGPFRCEDQFIYHLIQHTKKSAPE